MRLCSVQLCLVVTLQRAGGRPHKKTTTVQLMLIAVDEDAARTRARLWFEKERALPTAKHLFGSGLSEAIDIQLDSRHHTPITVFEHTSDVILVS